MKNKTTLILVILFGFSNYIVGDTIVCCNTDTLTLAYEYDDILYYDSCDIQLNDILVISPDCDVYVQIFPVDTSFNFWLSKYKPHLCPPISCEFDNNITKVSGDGIYRAFEYINNIFKSLSAMVGCTNRIISKLFN